jgi:hypothetical protein
VPEECKYANNIMHHVRRWLISLSLGIRCAARFGDREGLKTALPPGAPRTCCAVWGSQAKWKRYVSDEFYEVMHVGLGSLGWQVYTAGMRADFLLFVEDFDGLLAQYGKLPVKRYAIFVDDLHWHTDKMHELKRAVMNMDVHVLSTYAYLAKTIYPDTQARWTWIPHSAASRFQRNMNTTATYDKVLLTGADNKFWYPLRAQARLNPLVHQVKHPGYGRRGQDTEFVPTMLQYAVGITSGSIMHYAIAKFMEIPAVGQLLMADRAMASVLGRLKFTPDVHYVLYDSANMSAALQYVRSPENRAHVTQMRAAGQKVVMQYHTTRARAQNINSVAHRAAQT